MTHTNDPFEQFTREVEVLSEKLVKSYEVLAEIKEVDIATAPKDLVWKDGKVKLYHYHNPNKITYKTPLLIVYALVNRYEMMDLQPDRSIIRNLLSHGMDIYLIDWGYADHMDRYKTMEDYIDGHIYDCVEYVKKAAKVPQVNLLGVCQGGTFSTIYSSLYTKNVKNLITLVTPIDFSVNDGLLFKWSKDFDVDAIVDGYDGVVPGEFLNVSFEMLKPMGRMRKLAMLADTMQDKAKALNFLRMEKWINDSPSQAGECYRQFLKEMYQGNKLFKGELVLGGKKVHLKNLTMPLLNIYADEDHLVPPSSSIPLNDAVGSKDKLLYKFPGGHIGVFVGGRSQKELAPTIATFLKDRDN